VPSLSGDKAFSSRENNARESERASRGAGGGRAGGRALSLVRQGGGGGGGGGDERAGEYLSADSALEQPTARVSCRRLSAGESRGLAAAKKAKERDDGAGEKRERRRNEAGERRKGEKNCANGLGDFIARRLAKRRIPHRDALSIVGRVQSGDAIRVETIEGRPTAR